MRQLRKAAYRCNPLVGIVAKALVFGVLMSGCTQIIKGSPKLPTYQEAYVDSLVEKYTKADKITAVKTKEERNVVIEDLIYLIDVNYQQFESELFFGRATFDTFTDLAILGLGAAGGLIEPAGTKAILAVVSGGIGGARASIDKNFFREQSANALISTMRASRKKKLNFIRDAQTLKISDYPMSRALGDIIDYYNAGTIVGALGSIISEAGQKEQKAAAAIEKKIEVQFKAGPLKNRIIAWLDADPKKNVPEFQKWLGDKIPPVSLSPSNWVDSKDTTDLELLEAIVRFQIPE